MRPIAVVTMLLVLASATPAYADAISDKKAQAAAVQAQISALDTKAEIATENYNTARDRYQRLTGQVHQTEQRIGVLKTRTSKLQKTLDARVVVMYRDPLGFLAVLLDTRSFEDFATTLQLMTNISAHDANTVAQLKQAREEASAARATLKVAQATAAKQQAAMGANRDAVLADLGSRKQVLGGISADIRTLIAEQQAAEAAAARQRLAALHARQAAAAHAAQFAAAAPDPAPAPKPSSSRRSSSSPHRSPSSSPKPSGSSRGAKAVWWAEQELGKPYEWAAAGPDSFDCSGLTMWAYDHVGVSLPHSSQEQIGYGTRVSRSQLEPGDLVFFGSPIHHVGMYVGGGQFIEAPHTGADVRISDLSNRSDYARACRP